MYTIEFSTTQDFIPSTASFSLMVFLDVYVLFSLGTHVVNAFLYFIFVFTTAFYVHIVDFDLYFIYIYF